MNLDKIKALIRLANNNPNEHEANLAARRVCSILAENNFALLQPQKPAAAGGTWNDVKRSTEPQWRSKPPDPEYQSRSYDNFSDFFRGFNKSNFYGGARGGGKTESYDKETKKNWTDSAPHINWDDEKGQAYRPGYKYKDNERYDPISGKRTRDQEMRKCSKCGLEIMTYRFKEDPWICNQCHWNAEKKEAI